MPPFVIPFSLWTLIAVLVLFFLQMLPGIGIFLMFLGAGLLNGFLVHVFLIALFVEAIARRVPLFVIVIPIAAYSAYYITLAREANAIADRAAELRAVNRDQTLRFDPDTHSLVVENAGKVVRDYKIPVAYASSTDSSRPGYRAYRLIRRDQCDMRKDAAGRISASAVVLDGVQLCLLSLPEAPARPLVMVMRQPVVRAENRDWDISEQATDLVIDGKTVASYRTASVQRMPPLPIASAGCRSFNSRSKLECGLVFQRVHEVIDTTPEGVDRARYDTPVSFMLGIPKYTSRERAEFRGYPQNDAVLPQVSDMRDRADDEIFAVLDDIIAGKNPKLADPFFAHALVQRLDRLSLRAEGMARRLTELTTEPTATRAPHRRDQVRALENALSALPPDAFARVADTVFGVMRAETSREELPVLYLRAADAGTATFEFYKREFMTSHFEQPSSLLPVLAICRIGQVDAETIAEMKRQLVATKGDPYRWGYRSGLAVALLKLGQDAFLREQASAVTLDQREWLTLLLDQKGRTSTGPNNCMPARWEIRGYVPPIMAPTLFWNLRHWVVRPGS